MRGQVAAAEVQHSGYQINKPPTAAIFHVYELANNSQIAISINDFIVMAVKSILIIAMVVVNVII